MSIHCDKKKCRYYGKWEIREDVFIVGKHLNKSCDCEETDVCGHYVAGLPTFYRCVACEHFKKLKGYVEA